MSAILEVKNLKTQFHTDDGKFLAVDDITFSLEKGKTLGIVGESGCGKSVTSLSIMRLIPDPPGKIVGGEIRFEGRDLLKLSEREMRSVRGNDISMIFQEPMTSLNPVFTIGEQISEAIELHQKELSRDQVRKRTVEMLDLVGIPAPEKRVKEFPHQLSGGMRQRVMIAMALSCNPKLLIADEPTTALDVTIQSQILDLIRKLQQDLGTSMILITHDLGVVAETCDDVAVMYAGKIVEYGSVRDIFFRPQHQYTAGLLRSIPHFESGHRRERLETIPGIVPSLLNLPKGCRYQDRCPAAQNDCRTVEPTLKDTHGHLAACYHPVGPGRPNTEKTLTP
ncbi:MAG: peptide ABC transporter ATP-binding protein [Bdellovibrionales bacterium CG10_big_fil_rev_8_21_14_0_10_45_34]|nr:MAG: peptide ABC transporter ATP-binding protein [Bdellovibrionales bacterium CG10_big_fil_rev_8_21_14_0_10_45_34]